MRALLIGAVEGTRVALEAIAAAPDWELAAVATLPPDLAHRHSDFVALEPGAAAAGAALIHARNVNSDEFLAQVARIAPDMIFVIGWSQLCGLALRATVGGRMVGYHTAALPRLRGRATIPWTILLDEKITASTLFRIDGGVDDGAILAQHFFHVAADETAATLYAKHMQALGRMLPDLLARLAAGDEWGQEQDDGYATYAARRRPEDGRIDWRAGACDIDRLVRAVGRPYPGAFTSTKGETLTIWRAEAPTFPGRHHALPGQVIARDDNGFTVCCGDGGLLRITEHGADQAPPLHDMLGR